MDYKFGYFTSSPIQDRMLDCKICEMEADDDNKMMFRDIPRPSLVDAVCLLLMS